MEIRIRVSRADGREVADIDRQALIRSLEGYFGMHPTDVASSGAGLGWTLDGMALIGEPSADMAEWRRVALSKWRHFKEIWHAYEVGSTSVHGNSHVAIDLHAYSLAKMIPYLLGMPEEALPDVPANKPNRLLPSERAFRQETHGEWAPKAGPIAYQPGDPHHHEERMPAYPTAGLDFTDPQTPEQELPGMWERADFEGGADEVRPSASAQPVPDAFEHGKPSRKSLPLCGEVYEDGDFRAECTVDANWPHEEHSNGEWHWRTPGPVRGKPKFMRGAEDEDDEYVLLVPRTDPASNRIAPPVFPVE